jgi:predicted molibdopterin-dependent oxidoreductase YjgC
VFIRSRTEGFDDYVESLEHATPEWAEKITGVPAEDIRQAARMYATAKAAAVYWGMGISQSVHGTDNAIGIVNLAMMCGHLGKPGTGLNPLRGQNNVQGAQTAAGCRPSSPLPAVDNDEVRHKFEQAWGVTLNSVPGLTVTEIMDGALSGRIRAMFIMGEDPMTSEPNLEHARHAMEALDFIVSQDIFMNDSAKLADVILPSTSFAEKDGTFTNSDRRVQRVRRAVPQVGESRPDWEILCDLAKRIEARLRRENSAGFDYKHPSEIWDEMRELTPDFWGITYERLDRENGVHWPCPSEEHPGTPYLFSDSFPRGRGKFWSIEYGNESELPDAEYPFILSTGRVLYHWHGGAISRHSNLEVIWPEATVEMDPADPERLGLATGDWVNVRSRRGNHAAGPDHGRSPEERYSSRSTLPKLLPMCLRITRSIRAQRFQIIRCARWQSRRRLLRQTVKGHIFR